MQKSGKTKTCKRKKYKKLIEVVASKSKTCKRQKTKKLIEAMTRFLFVFTFDG